MFAEDIRDRHSLAARFAAAVGLSFLLVLVGTLSGGARAAAAAPTPAQLSISIDNGRTTAAKGDSITYKIQVHNIGTAGVNGLLVTQSLPAGLTFVTADSGGKHVVDQVQWRMDVPAGQAASRSTTMKVVATPNGELRLASVACATLKLATSPLVCASHSDQLPAGAIAATAAAKSAANTGTTQWWEYAAAALVLLILLAAGWVILAQRRTRRRAVISGVEPEPARSSADAMQ